MPAISLLTSTGFGSSGCWREKASRRCVNCAARSAPVSALSSARSARASTTPRLAMPRLPMMMVEQIVEVVRDAAGQLADRLHLLRLPQRLLGQLRGARASA